MKLLLGILALEGGVGLWLLWRASVRAAAEDRWATDPVTLGHKARLGPARPWWERPAA